jgi:hypothetical protein
LSTDTNDLIGKLAASLKPVRRIAPAWARAALLSVFALAAVFGCIYLCTDGLRHDWTVMLDAHLCQSCGMLVAGMLAAFAAFTLSVPDTKIRLHVYAMTGIATGIWVALILGQLTAGPLSLSVFGERNCLTDLVLLAIAPCAGALFMATRSAPVWRGWAGYSLMLSIGSFAALGMRFLCPNEEPAHLLVWHFLPVLGLALFGILLGEFLLKWKVAKI